MAQCPQLVVRTKTSKIRYHAGRRGKQVRRGFSGKFLVNINCRTYAWVAQRKSTVLITQGSGFRYSPQAPPERELRRLTSTKKSLCHKENVSGYNRQISFLYGFVAQRQSARLLSAMSRYRNSPRPPWEAWKPCKEQVRQRGRKSAAANIGSETEWEGCHAQGGTNRWRILEVQRKGTSRKSDKTGALDTLSGQSNLREGTQPTGSSFE